MISAGAHGVAILGKEVKCHTNVTEMKKEN